MWPSKYLVFFQTTSYRRHNHEHSTKTAISLKIWGGVWGWGTLRQLLQRHTHTQNRSTKIKQKTLQLPFELWSSSNLQLANTTLNACVVGGGWSKKDPCMWSELPSSQDRKAPDTPGLGLSRWWEGKLFRPLGGCRMSLPQAQQTDRGPAPKHLAWW